MDETLVIGHKPIWDQSHWEHVQAVGTRLCTFQGTVQAAESAFPQQQATCLAGLLHLILV